MEKRNRRVATSRPASQNLLYLQALAGQNWRMTKANHVGRRSLISATALLIATATSAHSEDVHWITGEGNNTEIETRYGTAAAPLSWLDTTKWFTDTGNPQTPNDAIPMDGQSVAHSNSCCNPEPFVDIDNGGAGINLPNSAIRFDAKTNLLDSSAGDLTDLNGGSYDFSMVDDVLTADTIAFNGAGGANNDIYVPVVANTFTSNRHGAILRMPFTVDTILARSAHQDNWVINASPTAPLTLIELDENRGPDGGSIDGSFTINADLTTATLNHVWSRLVVGAGATLTVGTYNLSDYSAEPENNNPAPIVLDGEMVVENFNFGEIAQSDGTWGAIGSGADNEVDWITGDGLLTVGSGSGPRFVITQIELEPGDMITLTWNSKPEKFYTIRYSSALSEFIADVADDVLSQGETTSHTFENPEDEALRLFFRVSENQ